MTFLESYKPNVISLTEMLFLSYYRYNSKCNSDFFIIFLHFISTNLSLAKREAIFFRFKNKKTILSASEYISEWFGVITGIKIS